MYRVACLQLMLRDEETKAQRLDRVETLLRSHRGVQLYALPEVWGVGYFAFDDYAAGAESLQGETVSRLAACARELDAYLFGGSLLEQGPNGQLYNTSVLLDPSGRLTATYRKMHLFGYRSREAELLTRGDQVVVAATDLGTLGLSTCYDLRFPELYRAMLDQGAETFLVASAWPLGRLEHWQLFTRVRAVENQCYLIACNCAGSNRGTALAGNSLVVDPWGTAVARAGEQEAVLTAQVDRGLLRDLRAAFPVLQNRVLRPDLRE